jgi:hypothetical protein
MAIVDLTNKNLFLILEKHSGTLDEEKQDFNKIL